MTSADLTPWLHKRIQATAPEQNPAPALWLYSAFQKLIAISAKYAPNR